MKIISLTKGKAVMVDDEDWEYLSQWKWCVYSNGNNIYAGRREKGALVLMHRVVNGTPKGVNTDHRDGNGLNNQRANLRNATQLQNMMNRAPKRGGTSVYKGVWLDTSRRNRNQWRAAIRLSGKLKYLGRFASEHDAGRAYEAASREHFGEFHRPQFGAPS